MIASIRCSSVGLDGLFSTPSSQFRRAPDSSSQRSQARWTGGSGFSKAIEPAELLSTVRQVARGNYPINDVALSKRSIATKVLGEFQALSVYGPRAPSIFAPLSPREIEVLNIVTGGMTNKEIAHALSLSEQTVKNHMTSILRKLSVNDRTQAVVYAIRQGWIELPPLV
jgi:DNA-binding NarL/FixJ family response regulator